MKARKVVWSELPPELLEEISDYLTYDPDYRSFRGVCKGWRNSCPTPSTHFLSRTLTREITSSGQTLHLIPSLIVLIRSSDDPTSCWIVRINEFKPGKLQLHHPMTNKPIFESSNSLNFKDFRPLKLCSKISVVVNEDDVAPQNQIQKPFFERKSIYISPNMVAILLHQKGLYLRSSDGIWKRQSFQDGFPVHDIIEFKGRVCAVNSSGEAYLCHGDGDGDDGRNIEKISNSIRSCPNKFRNRKALATDDEELYLIAPRGILFEVYRLNEELHLWERICDLGDKILVVTSDWCFFLKTRFLPSFVQRNVLLISGGVFAGGYYMYNLNQIFQRLPKHLFELFRPLPSWPFSSLRETQSMLTS